MTDSKEPSTISGDAIDEAIDKMQIDEPKELTSAEYEAELRAKAAAAGLNVVDSIKDVKTDKDAVIVRPVGAFNQTIEQLPMEPSSVTHRPKG